ncbi:MAG: HD domain-containing phosphohydrolase [bacterium]
MDNELEQLREEKERLRMLLDFGHKVSTEILNLDDLLKLIMAEARQILNADRCSVFIMDSDTKTLWSKIADGLEDKEIRLPAGKGIIGAVAESGEILNIKDAYGDERFNAETDSKTGYKTRTVLAAPMKNNKGEIIGVFQVLNKQESVFNEEDEKILLLLARQAGDAVENAFLYEEQKKMFESFIETLSHTLDKRDALTAGHSLRVTYFSLKLGEKLALRRDEIDLLKYSSWMHDLGKIGVREHILAKMGALTDEEFEKMKMHTNFTKEILERIYFKKEFRGIPLIASSHHENVDGSGYPDKLRGTAVPFLARIIAVCDVFDAITSKRHYREPMPVMGVLRIIKEGTGKKFDESCVAAFFKINLYEVLAGINLEKVDNFFIIPDEKKLLEEYTLEDFYRILNVDNFTAPQHKIVETFGKYYGR